MKLQACYIINTVRVCLPKCPLTTVRSRFSADELQIVRGEASMIYIRNERLFHNRTKMN